MDLRLRNKVAFVGGSSKGIGKGIALQLAKEGANIILCSRNEEDLKKTAELITNQHKVNVLPIAADLSNINEIKDIVAKCLDHFGRIDILVANSGGPKPGKFFDLDNNDWETAYNSVLLYVIELYMQIIPIMKKNGWGRIVNITSVTVKEPSETLVLSNVFRSGVTSLAKSISGELFEEGITINNVCPGSFRTDRALQLMKDKASAENKTLEQVEEELTASLPGKSFSSIEDIGNLVTFLASDSAKEITGTTIQIDRGVCKGLF